MKKCACTIVQTKKVIIFLYAQRGSFLAPASDQRKQWCVSGLTFKFVMNPSALALQTAVNSYRSVRKGESYASVTDRMFAVFWHHERWKSHCIYKINWVKINVKNAFNTNTTLNVCVLYIQLYVYGPGFEFDYFIFLLLLH